MERLIKMNAEDNDPSSEILSTEMMTTIDSLKEQMTDDTYKQLCDKLMELNRKEKTIEEHGFYEMTIVINSFVKDECDCDVDFEDVYVQDTKIEKRYIKISHKMAKEHIDYINQHSYINIPYDVFKDQVNHETSVNAQGHCITCDEIGHYKLKILKPFVCVVNMKKVQ